MATTTIERINIGISGEALGGVIDILNRVLSDSHVLYIKTRAFHWNVTGMHFQNLHELFQQQYTVLETAIDEIAEHARSRGGWALGSMAEFLQHTHLKEQPRIPEARAMVEELLADHETIIRFVRESVDRCEEKYHDTTTADFLTGLLKEHEKMAWMLRAHLEAR